MHRSASLRKGHRLVARFGTPASAAVVALLLGTLAPAARAQSTITFAGSGANPQTSNIVAAQATFSIISNGSSQSLVIDLFNTSVYASGNTNPTNRGDLLSTVLFNFTNSNVVTPTAGVSNVVASLYSSSPADTPSSPFNFSSVVFDSSTGAAISNPSLTGKFSFGDETSAGGSYNYGVSSSGFTNASGLGTVHYSFSGLGKGGGGDDYGIAGYNSQTVNGGAVPIIRDSVQITISGFTGLTSVNQIANVGFGFASGAYTNGAYNIIPGTPLNPVPAPPAAVSLLIGGLVGAATFGGRRLRKRAAAATRPPAG